MWKGVWRYVEGRERRGRDGKRPGREVEKKRWKRWRREGKGRIMDGRGGEKREM